MDRPTTPRNGLSSREVVATARYALAVEYGTRPGYMPPWRGGGRFSGDAFLRWCIDHNRDPRSMALHILRFGTKPNPFMRRALARASV